MPTAKTAHAVKSVRGGLFTLNKGKFKGAKQKMNKKLLSLAIAVVFALGFASFIGCKSNAADELTVESGKDTVISETVDVTPDNYDAKKAVYAAIGRLSKLNTYKSESTGTSVATVLGAIGYTQQTDCVFIKHGDEFYTSSDSESKFVSVKQEVFAKGENVAYRVNGGEIKNTRAQDYKDVFGVTPDKLLSGHIFNDETIVYAELTSAAKDEYSFKIVLDKDKGNALLFKQMKEYGNLNAYPVFTDNTIVELTLKSDYTPVKLSYTSKYIVSVSILGNLPCVEKNEVVFSDFNKEVVIPDTEAFNQAMSAQPSEVTPSEEKIIDKNQEKIIGALLKADFIRGVALSGTVECNDFRLPVKINGRADIDKIINDENADIFSLVDLKASLGIYEDSLAITYHDKKLYFDLADVKFVKELDLADMTGEMQTAFSELKAIDVFSYLKITQEKDDVYRIRLNDSRIESVIKKVLVSSGLAGANLNECFDLSVGLYIPTDRVGVVSLNLTTDLIDLGAKFNLSDEKFVLPEDENYSNKPQILKTGFNATIDLAGFTATAKAYVSYDVSEFNLQKAVKAELNVTLGAKLKEFLAQSNSYSSEVPAWIGTIAEADTVNLVYSDGKLMLIALSDGKPTFAKEIPFGQTSGQKIADKRITDFDDLPFDLETLKSLLSGIFELKISDDVVSLNVKSEVIDLIGIFWNELPELIIKKLGTSGSTLAGFISKPIENIGVDFDLDSKKLTVYVDAYDVNFGAGKVYIKGKDYEISRLLYLSFSGISADDYSYDWDIGKIYEDCIKAEKVIESTDRIYEVSVLSGYVEDVGGVKALYEGLTNDQKLLCYNVSGAEYYDELIAKRSELIKAVDDFARLPESEKIGTLNAIYNNFNEEQLKYLSDTYPDFLKGYMDKRVKSEASSVASLKTFIDRMTVHTAEQFDEMSEADVYKIFNTFAGRYQTYASLCDESRKGLDEAKFKNELNGVVKAYICKIGALTENTKKEVLSSDGLSVDELLSLYDSVTNFDKKYFTNFKNKKIWNLVQQEDADLEVQRYLVQYYLLYNGCAFRKYAVSAIDEEINALTELAKGEYDEDELNRRVADIDKLMELTDKSAVSCMDKFNVLKASYYESIVGELKKSLPEITETMTRINADPQTVESDEWDSVYNEVKNYESMINLLADEYKERISTEIESFNDQKKDFYDNYYDSW